MTDLTKITITFETSIHKAFSIMDKQVTKLLFIVEKGKFKGLISAGDIQRAILNNISLNSSVKLAIRKNNTVVNPSTPTEEVKKLMLEKRIECMPVVDAKSNLVKVYYWEDFFVKKTVRNKKLNKVPVVIMAGGFGTRLKPLTNVLPKPLIPINEKSIIEVIMERFNMLGAHEFHISVNYKKELIQFYLAQNKIPRTTIQYVSEEKPLGTAGSLYLLKKKLKSTFFMTNCDILIDEDYNSIFEYHKKNKNIITLVACVKNYNIPYGTVEAGINGELIALKEKPELVFLINTGMYIIEPAALKYLDNGNFMHITTLMENIKADNGKVGVYPISEGSWHDIGEWPEYQKVIDKYK
jgi:dTDP-glucose pyrophosphorylase